MDASAIFEALLRPEAARRVVDATSEAIAIAPEGVDFEVLAALRRAVYQGRVSEEGALVAIEKHLAFGLERVPARFFLHAAWELRQNLTAADALYVAVARAFGATLVTADARLAAAPGLGIAVTVLPS